MKKKYEDKEHIVLGLNFEDTISPALLKEMRKCMSNKEIMEIIEEGIREGLGSYTTGKVSIVKTRKPQDN